jgi:uncharacterized membrane protein YkvA (DUF1232 family)
MATTPLAKRWRTTGRETMPAKEAYGFRAARTQAKSYVQDKKKTSQLLQEVLAKAYRDRAQLRTIWKDLMSMCRMLRAWSIGDYKTVPWRTLVLSLATVIYFLNPFDLSPDFIPGVGYVDDAVVLGFVASSIKRELDRFLRWESEDSTT